MILRSKAYLDFFWSLPMLVIAFETKNHVYCYSKIFDLNGEMEGAYANILEKTERVDFLDANRKLDILFYPDQIKDYLPIENLSLKEAEDLITAYLVKRRLEQSLKNFQNFFMAKPKK